MQSIYRKPGFIAQNGKQGSFAAGCPAEQRYGIGLSGCFGCDTTCGKIMGVITAGMWSLLCCALHCCGGSTDCTTCEMSQ